MCPDYLDEAFEIPPDTSIKLWNTKSENRVL